MKNFKKFAAMVSALALASCAIAPAVVNAVVTTTTEDVDSGSITINTEESDHAYSAYQIFDGTLTKEIKVDDLDDADPTNNETTTTVIFTGVSWGSGIKKGVDNEPVAVAGKTIYEALAELEIVVGGSNVFTEKNPEWTATINEGKESTDPAWVHEYIPLDSADKVSKQMEKITSNKNITAYENIDKIAKVLEKYKFDTATAVNTAYDSTNKKYVINITDPGYYLVTDAPNSAAGLAEGEAISKYILQVADDVSVNPKADAPKVMKKVKEDTYNPDEADKVSFAGNDNFALAKGYNDAADYSIGENIPFSLYGSLPQTFANYKGYYYKFTDNMGAGLDLVDKNNDNEIDEKDFVVTVIDGSKEVQLTSSQFTYTDFTSPAKGFTIAIDNLKAIDMDSTVADVQVMSKDAIIKVDYVATLNQSAVIGKEGNPNDVKLTYSNNSNTAQGGDSDTTTDTEKDYNVVFTYELDVTKYLDKIDNSNKAAKDAAGFKLYKEVSGTKYYAKLDAVQTEGEGTETTDDVYDYKFNSWVTTEEVATEMLTQSGGKFAIVGLQDGTYKLKETKTPATYNPINDVTVVITAEGDDNSDDTKKAKVTDIVLQNYKETEDTAEGKVLKDLTIKVDEEEVASSTAVNKGVVAANIINHKGNGLPSTGGIGTTLFYLGGGTMVAVAGVFLITKKRMGKREE